MISTNLIPADAADLSMFSVDRVFRTRCHGFRISAHLFEVGAALGGGGGLGVGAFGYPAGL